MPRKITIFLAAPPGDGLRSAREYFQEYVKPFLVAAALDWDVVEGRREGEVRAGLAEKIRKFRKRNGEVSGANSEDADAEDLVEQTKKSIGIRQWDGFQGDLVIGRHTWKEYIRGLHEGWLGPLDPPPEPPHALSEVSLSNQTLIAETQEPPPSAEPPPSTEIPPPTETPAPQPDPPKKPISPLPPYISPSQYSTLPLAPTIPSELPPSTPLPLPHILGFLNTPIRIQRFLTRRRLADRTGRDVAALVLAAYTRQYEFSNSFASSVDPDSPTTGADRSTDLDGSNSAVLETGKIWEQQRLLEEEEREWHKSARKPNPAGEEGKERVWLEEMVVDERIGQRMRRFELGTEDKQRARATMDGDAEDETNSDSLIEKGQGFLQSVKRWAGFEEDRTAKGWEDGLVGNESE